MQIIEFKLSDEYIPLNKLLKLLRLVDSGGMAKRVIDDGLVKLNGKLESRIRAKLRIGDEIEFNKNRIIIQ